MSRNAPPHEPGLRRTHEDIEIPDIPRTNEEIAQLPIADLDRPLEEDSERITSTPTGLQLIALGGFYECGKDAWADELVWAHGYKKTWMSYPLHKWLLEQNPWIRLDHGVWSLEQFYFAPGEFVTYAWLDYHVGYVEMKRQREVRNQLQKVGTNCGRKMIDWDIWVDAMKRQIHEWVEQGQTKLIVTGIRYPNELQAIRDLGGDALWVERPEARYAHEARLREDSERVARGEAPLVHDSDLALTEEDFDAIILNDGSLAELKGKAREWHVTRYGS